MSAIQSAGLELSGEVLFATFIGGIGTFLGPIVGAILFTFLRATLSEMSSVWHLYLGAIFLLTVVFAPTGIAGLVLMHEPIWKVDFKLLRRMVLPVYRRFGRYFDNRLWNHWFHRIDQFRGR